MVKDSPSSLRGQLLKQQPLANYTSWRVGGPADVIYIPADKEDLAVFLHQLSPDTPLLWLGLGSNVLIRDGGFPGTVIVVQGALKHLEQQEGQLIYAEAGVSCGQLARFAARLGLAGLEWMAGVPGTVGGALAMNAGCYGGETWQQVVKVETMNRWGERHFRSPADYEIAYRYVKGIAAEWFVAGYFLCRSGERKQLLSNIHDLIEKRNATQPTGLPNCGSVFRNPPENYAARLIEQCGLKKMAIGGAYVSEKHANFIINDGTATAADIESLIFYIKNQVLQRQGVHLHPEVCIIGKSMPG